MLSWRRSVVTSTALFSLFATFTLFIHVSAKVSSIHTHVNEDLAQWGHSRFLVTLSETADISAAASKEQLFALYAHEHGLADISQFTEQHHHHYAGHHVYYSLKHVHEHSRKELKKVIQEMNGIIHQEFIVCNTMVVEGDKDLVELLAAHESVIEIHTTRPFYVDLERSSSINSNDSPLQDPLAFANSFINQNNLAADLNPKDNDDDEDPSIGAIQWNVKLIGADRVWSLPGNNTRGEGTIYGNADTGIDWKHPAITTNYMGRKNDSTIDHNYSWWDGIKRPLRGGRSTCPVNSTMPCDDNGHGTHTLSTTIGAMGMGVADGAKWIGCRNMYGGVGSAETYLSCLNFFLAPTDLAGNNPNPSIRPHVVGNSYGCPHSEGCAPNSFSQVAKAYRAAGIVMSVSVGNDGPGCSSVSAPPGTEPLVFSVAATDARDMLASFSSRGPVIAADGSSLRKPDISAPGVRVYGAFPNNQYRTLSGTSMASPHIGGVVLLITAQCPYLARRVDDIEELIKHTAKPLYPTIQLCGNDSRESLPNNHYGWGRVDVWAAVQECKKARNFSSHLEIAKDE